MSRNATRADVSHFSLGERGQEESKRGAVEKQCGSARKRACRNDEKTMPGVRPWSPAERRGAREVATMLGLHHLCRQSRCRKAQACCGEPRACLARHAAAIPQPVRDFAIAMLDASARGFTAADARERFAHLALAHATWLAGLAAAGHSGSRRKAVL